MKTTFDEMCHNVFVMNEFACATKPKFEAVIKDKSIPLADRWKLFLDAPDSLKNHQGWAIDLLDKTDISWFDDFNCERYQILTAERIIDYISEYDHENKYAKSDDMKYLQDRIEEVQEELLSRNLGSFVNDW